MEEVVGKDIKKRNPLIEQLRKGFCQTEEIRKAFKNFFLNFPEIFLRHLVYRKVVETVSWPDISGEEEDPVPDQAIKLTTTIIGRSLAREMSCPERIAGGMVVSSLRITRKEINKIEKIWREIYSPEENIEGFANFILGILRKEELIPEKLIVGSGERSSTRG